jgi:hypothetical protein
MEVVRRDRCHMQNQHSLLESLQGISFHSEGFEYAPTQATAAIHSASIDGRPNAGPHINSSSIFRALHSRQ